jgi:biopolymer transport protein ExbD
MVGSKQVLSRHVVDRSMRWISVLVFAAAMPSCKPRSACDERALGDAITSFETNPGADDAPLELVNAMSSACPDFPEALFQALGYTHVESDPDELYKVILGKRYKSARRTACTDPNTWSGRVADLPADQRAQAAYELCDFQRLGLLEVGEPFLLDDMPAMLAQHWMLEHHVDPALGRRFNRGLMFVTADERLSRRRCHARPDSLACQTLMRVHGSRLPASSVWLEVDHGPSLFVTPTWRAVGSAHGIEDASATHDLHLSRLQPTSGPADGLLLFADRQTPWGELIELMRIADARGYRSFSLVTERDDRNARLLLTPPAVWSADQHDVDDFERLAHFPVFVIEANAVRLPNDGGRVSLTELGRLEDIARAMLDKARYISFIVRAGPDVELQTVVTVLDALRGHDCTLRADVISGEVEPDFDCLAGLPIVDLDPPTQRRPGDWSRLRLSAPVQDAKAWDDRSGPLTGDQLQARVEQVLEPIRACLVASDHARIFMPERIALVFGIDALDQLGVGVLGPTSEWLPIHCIAAALDVPVITRSSRLVHTAFAEIEVPIEIPGK